MNFRFGVRRTGATGTAGLLVVVCLLGVQSGEHRYDNASDSDPDSVVQGRPLPRPDYPGEALAFRLNQWRDEQGVIPPNALMNAKAQADAMRATSRSSVPPPAAGINSATWTWVGPGNIGGRVRTLAIDPVNPDIMLAGSVGGGIFKTTNGGMQWAPADDFMANLAVSTIVIQPGNHLVAYAGTGEGFYNGDGIQGAGVFKTVDGGTTWTQLPSTASSLWYYVNRLSVSPAGDALLAATRTGIYRSADGAASWNRELTKETTDIAFDPRGTGGAIASGDAGDAYFSVNGGVTWNAAAGLPGGNLKRVELAYAPSSPDIVYASVDYNSGTIYKSTDGGQSYMIVSIPPQKYLGSQGWYDNAIWVDPTNPSTLIVGGINLWKSTDGGQTLAQISAWENAPNSAHADQHGIFAHPSFGVAGNATVFFTNDGGIYKASNVYTAGGGVYPYTSGWTSLNNTLGITQFYGAGGNASTGIMLGGTQDNGTLEWPDSGTSWSVEFGGDGGYSFVDPTNPNHLYGEYVYLQVHRSLDGGASSDWINGLYWNGVGSACKPAPYSITDSCRASNDTSSLKANFIAPFVIDPNNQNTVFAGGASLWRTTDATTPNTASSGPSWTNIKPPVGSTNYISTIAVAPSDSNQVWVGHNGGDLYKTSNGGSISPAWIRAGAGVLPARMVLRVRVDPLNASVVYVTYGGFATNNLWRSLDGGATWAPITSSGSTALPAVPIRDIAINASYTPFLYAATEIGIFTSQDDGASWTIPQDGPANVSVDELFWMGSDLVAATHGRGLFKTTTTAAPAPTVSSISPAVGATAGGSSILIKGEFFHSGAIVGIGGVAATSVSVLDAETILAVTGVHAAGVADVSVVNPDAQHGTMAGAFRFVAGLPVITTQPANRTISKGQNTTFTIAATGLPTFQWQVSLDGGSTWANLSNTLTYSGVTTSTLTVTGGVTGMNGYRYRAVVTNSAGASISFPATLIVRGGADLVMDFGPAYGVWTLFDDDPSTWTRLHTLAAKNIVTGDLDGNGVDEVIVDFGAPYGIWVWADNLSWYQLHPSTASHMAVGDLDGNGKAELLIDFPGGGIWVWSNNSTWYQLHPSNASNIVMGDLDGNGRQDAIVDFPGAGIWVWKNNTAWVQLHSHNSTAMVVGDFDGNGRDDVIIDFPNGGLWQYGNDAWWALVHPSHSVHLAAGDVDGDGESDLVVDFGASAGIWLLTDNVAWSQLHKLTAKNIVVGDVSATRRADVIVNFGSAGLWEYAAAGGWKQLHTLSPDVLAIGHIDGR